MYTTGMARQQQTLGSWHGHRQHYCDSQDTIWHNDRATNWTCVVCFLAGTGYCFLLQNIRTGSCDYSGPCWMGPKFKS